MPKTLITHDSNLHDRMCDFLGDFWSDRHPNPNYAERLLGRKKPLADLLGLPSADSGWLLEEQIDPPLSVRDLLEEVAFFVLNPGTEQYYQKTPVDLATLTVEYKGGRIKLIKLLRKAQAKHQRWAYQRLIRGYAHPTAPSLAEETELPNWDIWWPKLGDYLKSFTAKVFVSPDPILLLASGIGEDSNSCHRPGGQYQYGTFAYASDMVTLGAYLRGSRTSGESYLEPHTAGNSLNGRCLYWVPEITRPALVQGRNYFSFGENHQRLVRDFIEGRLRKYNGCEPEAWGTDGSVETQVAGATYMDSGHLKAYWLRSQTSKPIIDIQRGLCPHCLGGMGSDGCCMPAGGVKCCNCDGTFDPDDGYINDDGEQYCDDCWHEMMRYCDCCDGYASREDFFHTSDGFDLCEYCAGSRTTTCECCDDVYYDNGRHSFTEVENERGRDECWCENCVENHAFYCGGCEDYKTNEVYDSEEEVCDCCADVARENRAALEDETQEEETDEQEI